MKKTIIILLCLTVLNSCKKSENQTDKLGNSVNDTLVSNDTQGQRETPASPKEIDYLEYGISAKKSSVIITDNGIMADIQPYLPKLTKGEYRFVRFYNISNNNNYAVLCVLEMIGVTDVNLITYDQRALRSNTPVDGGNFNIAGDIVKNPLGSKELKNIESGMSITFICFHDDNFDETNSNDNEVLKFYRDRLPNIYVYPNHYSDPNKEPKRGNGGVLTVR